MYRVHTGFFFLGGCRCVQLAYAHIGAPNRFLVDFNEILDMHIYGKKHQIQLYYINHLIPFGYITLRSVQKR